MNIIIRTTFRAGLVQHEGMLRHVNWRQLFLMTLFAVMVLAAPATQATSSPPPTTVSVGVTYTPYFIPTYWATAHPSPYFFSFGINVMATGIPSKGDVYFGVVIPGQSEAFTWVMLNGSPSIKTGLVPLAREIDLTQSSVLTSSSILGTDISYAFTGQEPPGVYFVFAILTVSGTDPTDARNWISVDIVPLVVRF